MVVLLCFYWFGQFLCFESAKAFPELIYVALEVGSGGALIMMIWAIPYIHKRFLQTLKGLGFSHLGTRQTFSRSSEQFVHLVSLLLFFVYYTTIAPVLIGLSPFSHSIFRLAGTTSLVLNAIMSFIGSIIASDFLIEIISIVRYARRASNKLTIDVLDSDRCGGLKEMGAFFLTLDMVYFLLLSFSLLWITASVKIDINSIMVGIINSLGIILFGIGLFLFPQWEIHKRMKKSKEDFLGKVTKEIVSGVEKPEDYLTKIYYLILYERVEKMSSFLLTPE